MGRLSLLTSLVGTILDIVHQGLRVAFIWLKKSMDVSGNHGDKTPANMSSVQAERSQQLLAGDYLHRSPGAVQPSTGILLSRDLYLP